MNLPGVVVDLPTLTEKDVDDIVNWAIPNDIDFIAASFVRKGSDIDNIHKVWCVWLWFWHRRPVCSRCPAYPSIQPSLCAGYHDYVRCLPIVVNHCCQFTAPSIGKSSSQQQPGVLIACRSSFISWQLRR